MQLKIKNFCPFLIQLSKTKLKYLRSSLMSTKQRMNVKTVLNGLSVNSYNRLYLQILKNHDSCLLYTSGKLPLPLNRSSPKTIGLEYSTNKGCMQKII